MASILICGDFCPIGEAQELISSGRHDEIFNDFLKYSHNSDLAICNLECPLSTENSPSSKFGPALRGEPFALSTLKFANFGLVTLANNHIMDHGTKGLSDTFEACSEFGIDYTGAGFSLPEARNVYFKKLNEHTVGVYNIAENEFSNTYGNYPGANPLSLPKNFQDITAAKENCDYLIVIYHGGNELYQLPSPRIKETFRFFVDAGADAIIGHHPHCVSGYEIYKQKPIFFSIGNFLFDYGKNSDYSWITGMAVNLIFDSSIDFEIIPFQQFGNKPGIHLIKGDEKHTFLECIAKFNSVINDDEKLQQAFNEYTLSLKQQYFHFLQPTNNSFLHALIKRGMLPSLAFGKRRKLHHNLVRCEAHRDVLLNLFELDSHT